MNPDYRQRILLCAPGFPTSTKDPDKPFLLDHANSLVAVGFNVTVICPTINGLPARDFVGHIEVVRVRYAPQRFQTLAATGSMYSEAKSWKIIWVLPMIISMVRAARKEIKSEPAIAYGHWWIPGGLVAVLASWRTKNIGLVHFHGSDVVVAKGLGSRFLARRVARAADLCLAVSDDLAAWVQRISGRTASVLPMPIAVKPVQTPSIPPKDGYVLGVGRLVYEKGFDVLIDAVAAIDQEQRPKLIIVGIGPEREHLERRARRQKVQLELPGAIPPDEMVHWYEGAKFVVVPSRREGFGMVAAEAAMSSRAVVGTTVGAIPSIVKHGVSGLLVEPENVLDLQRSIQNIDPQMGLRGPEQVADLTGLNHARQLQQICEDLLN